MSAYFLLAFFALMLHSTSAQQDTCTDAEITAYINGLPNGADCVTARATNFIEPTDSVLATLCSANCARPLVEYQILNCSDLGVFFEVLSCIPTGGSSSLGRFCRYSLADLPALEGIFNSLAACAAISEGGVCPAGCAAALKAAQATVGCCYQHIYNDPEVLASFVESRILSQENATFLTDVIANTSLWTACGVAFPAFCDGELFPSTTGQQIGTCTESQIESFAIKQLSESCTTNIVRSFNDTMLSIIDFDTLCTTSCAGRVAEFERSTCNSEFHAALTELACLPADKGATISRCRSAFSVNTTALFATIGANCFASATGNPSCPTGCRKSLVQLSSQLGCCYQTFYNDTFLGHALFLFSDTYTTDSVTFFAALNDPMLWNACNVPLIDKCQGEPFVDDGSIRFTASATDLPHPIVDHATSPDDVEYTL